MSLPGCRLARIIVAAAAVLGAAEAPADAANKKTKPRQPLDLELRHSDIRAPSERRHTRGYAVTMRESPWRVLADEVPPLAGFGIPQVSDDMRANPDAGEEELTLKGLLDGETITFLRIRLAPESPSGPRSAPARR